MKINFKKIFNILSIVLFVTTIAIIVKSIFELLRRDGDLTSETGKKVLEDDSVKKEVFDALNSGKSEIETKYGTLLIQ
jgi:hypothetical protein